MDISAHLPTLAHLLLDGVRVVDAEARVQARCKAAVVLVEPHIQEPPARHEDGCGGLVGMVGREREDWTVGIVE